MKELGKQLLVRIGRLIGHRRLWAFLWRQKTRYVLSWLLALVTALGSAWVAWTLFDNSGDDHRRDGNYGHATIDFGGQYLMGRMLVRGHGRELYHRNVQRRVLAEVYPREDEDPEQDQSDVENLMLWMMGKDDPDVAGTIASTALPLAAPDSPLARLTLAAAAQQLWTEERLAAVVSTGTIGGPLYPPVHSLVFYPLALLRPGVAYRLVQVLCIVLAFTAGLALRMLSRGRIWWPVASTAVMLFPGFAGSINLGQNAVLTLNILAWGWVVLAAGYPAWSGVIWGLLAYKPVWAVAFFLVPVLSRRWRMAVAMVAGGTFLSALTLPWAGLQDWLDWLKIGGEASQLYQVDQNWIHLSRDLLSIPQRWLNFDLPAGERITEPTLAIIGWSIFIACLELTVRWSLFHAKELKKANGPASAFLLLGAWLCCFHFMYYDVLLGVLPFCLLLAEPGRFLEPILLAIVPLRVALWQRRWARYYRPAIARAYPRFLRRMAAGPANVLIVNRVEPTLLVLILVVAQVLPLFGWGLYSVFADTVCLVALWAWSGWLVYWRSEDYDAATTEERKKQADESGRITEHGTELKRLEPANP